MVLLNINPLLINVMTGRSLDELPTSPKIPDLPGKYAPLVAKNLKKVPSAFPSNIQPLICKSCGKKAKYDLGHVAINILKYKPDQNDEIDQYIQSNGYFRCNHCNSAGNWEITNEYRMMAISALLTYNSPVAEDRYTFGRTALFDGSSHKYATDAEEYLLNKIMKSKDDSFLWNRLGNLYYKGGRADLAVSAFEYSLSIDPLQTESLFSLGMILSAINPKAAANHYHKMLISSYQYTRMDAPNLRDLLSNGLRDLFYLNSISNGEISVIPPISVYQELEIEIPNSEESPLQIIEGEVDSNNLESFYPIAELFLGERREELTRKKFYFMKKKKKRKK